MIRFPLSTLRARLSWPVIGLLALSLAACGGSDSPTDPGGGDGGGDDPGDTAADSVSFLNSYESTTTYGLTWPNRVRVYKSQADRIAVDMLHPSAGGSVTAYNLVTVGIDGTTVSEGTPYAYPDLNAAPDAWFEGIYSHMVRSAAGNQLVVMPDASGNAAVREYQGGNAYTGTLVGETVILDMAASGLAGAGYSMAQSGGGLSTPIAVSGSGYVTAVFMRVGASAGAVKVRVLWLDAGLSVTQWVDVDRAFSLGDQWCLKATGDGGVVIGCDILQGTYSRFGQTLNDADAIVLKVTPAGTAWSQTFDHHPERGQTVLRIVEDDGGNLLVIVKDFSSSSFSPGTDTSFSSRIYELSPFGGVLRTVMLPLPAHNVYDIMPRDNGKYLVAGAVASSYYNAAALFVGNLDENFMWTEVNVTP